MCLTLPEALVVQTGQHHAEREAGVELDGLGIICCGGARQTCLKHRQDLGHAVPLPHHQHRDQQGQCQAGTGASYGTRCVLT